MSGLQFSGDVVLYLLGLAVVWGSLLWRVGELEKKVDKHNNLVERMFKVEEVTKRCEGRIKELEALHPRQDT